MAEVLSTHSCKGSVFLVIDATEGSTLLPLKTSKLVMNTKHSKDVHVHEYITS